jgi:hypothetical protein
VALVVTGHVWNESIGAGVKPFMDSAVALGMRVDVLMTNSSRLAVLPSGSLTAVHFPPYAAVRGMTRINYSWWTHSHLLPLWYWRTVGRPAGLSAVWFLEYDVRGAGDLSRLWTFAPPARR